MSKPILWSPFQDLADMHERFNQMVTDSFGTPLGSVQLPTTDVYEEDGQLVVEAHLPHFEEKDVDVQVTDRGLEIKATHSAETKEKDSKRKYYVRESRSGTFYRFIALPREADKEKAEAHFKNGILKVLVPLKAQAQPKKLNLKTGK